MFVSWSLTTRDGKVHVGVIVDEGPNSTITVANAQGQLEVLKRQDVEERIAGVTEGEGGAEERRSGTSCRRSGWIWQPRRWRSG